MNKFSNKHTIKNLLKVNQYLLEMTVKNKSNKIKVCAINEVSILRQSRQHLYHFNGPKKL